MTYEKRKEIEEIVEKFKKQMSENYGVFPVVIYDVISAKLPLTDLLNIMDELLVNSSGGEHKSLKDKSRKQTLINHRQMFYKIAREMGYGFTYISGFLGFDHATAIHSTNRVTDLLNLRDPAMSKIYHEAKRKIAELHEEHISNFRETQTDSESTILAV